MIDYYSFGKISINGKTYNQDVIIYPDHVEESWWRKEGHNLLIEDLKDVVESNPEVLIVGTGNSGFMKVPSHTKGHLESLGMKLIVQPTEQACRSYNSICKSQRAIAALHLTC